MMKADFNDQYSAYLQEIETYLDEKCFQYDNEPQVKLFEAMRYSLLAGGKRLRPVFVFDFCRMCGGNWQDALPFAAAVEMVHTYSLIHDDLPCMDDDDLRRGRPTNHKVFGEAMAVLAGDALLTAAFSFISSAVCYDAQTRVRAIEILASCSGELGMVGGQVLDMQSEQRQCTEDEVIAIQTRKTGALIRASCMLGVLAGGGNEAQLGAASMFASNLGLAFQIRDDMLDIIGTPEELGKAVGTDSTKNTFVQLYGLERCSQMVREYTQKSIAALAGFRNADFMVQLAKQLTERNA